MKHVLSGVHDGNMLKKGVSVGDKLTLPSTGTGING